MPVLPVFSRSRFKNSITLAESHISVTIVDETRYNLSFIRSHKKERRDRRLFYTFTVSLVFKSTQEFCNSLPLQTSDLHVGIILMNVLLVGISTCAALIKFSTICPFVLFARFSFNSSNNFHRNNVAAKKARLIVSTFKSQIAPQLKRNY